jgi:DNA ligase-1
MSSTVNLYFSQVLQENVESCIIDSEAVAWDPERKQILPFQVLSTRKKKVQNKLVE